MGTGKSKHHALSRKRTELRLEIKAGSENIPVWLLLETDQCNQKFLGLRKFTFRNTLAFISKMFHLLPRVFFQFEIVFTLCYHGLLQQFFVNTKHDNHHPKQSLAFVQQSLSTAPHVCLISFLPKSQKKQHFECLIQLNQRKQVLNQQQIKTSIDYISHQLLEIS